MGRTPYIQQSEKHVFFQYIEHNCVVGDFVHLAVGAVLCGGVLVERNAFVGAGATVLQACFPSGIPPSAHIL